MRFYALTIFVFLTLCANGATLYNNLTFTNAIGVSSRPGGAASEVEAADDFILGSAALVNGATFTGLYVPGVNGGAPSPTRLDVEFYRVFPNDSDTVRTINVNTRVNSPSDVVAFASRDSQVPELSFQMTTLGNLTALNSVSAGGINPKPNQTTGGTGPITGTVVQFAVTFNSAVLLPADHYFFIPQVEFGNGGQFYWLSASRPITGAGTTAITPDLQAWVRNAALDPDWSRVGTDIIGGASAPTYNMAFSLDGTAVPEPAAVGLAGAALLLIGVVRRGR